MNIDVTHDVFGLKKDDSQNIKKWLLNHEQDIAMGIDDFGDIRELFIAMLKREPLEIDVP